MILPPGPCLKASRFPPANAAMGRDYPIGLRVPVVAEPERKDRFIQKENGVRNAGGYRDGKPVGSRPLKTDAVAESRGCAADVSKGKENPAPRQRIELVIIDMNVDAPHYASK